MSLNQRIWMIEHLGQGGWRAVPGKSYDNKRWAYQGLRITRARWKAEFPNDKFRIAEYVRKGE